MTTQGTKEFQPYSLEDLDQFELDNGWTCYIGNEQDIERHIEANGENMYYVIANGQFQERSTDGKTVTTVTRPAILKVVTSIIGRAVFEVKDEVPLDKIATGARFDLPKIPYKMVATIDAFFRAVDKKYDTEAIVILTYDTAIGGSEGWGFLVPDQENTSVACKYEADSIAGEYPETAFLVGTAHSHPGMSAYASGTDHKDQENSDGVHITYGWQASVRGGETQYHIEYQVAGRSFIMDPYQVFESVPKPEIDADIDLMLERVKKKSYTVTGSGGSSSYGGVSSSTTYGHKKTKANVPAGCPSIAQNLVIAELLTTNEQDCPWCQLPLLDGDFIRRRCLSCHMYLCAPGESLEGIIESRSQEGLYSWDLDPSQGLKQNVYIWRRTSDSAEPVFELVFEPPVGKS